MATATTTVTGGAAVVRALAAHGVDLVFGIPGTDTLPLHRHLAANGIRHEIRAQMLEIEVPAP